LIENVSIRSPLMALMALTIGAARSLRPIRSISGGGRQREPFHRNGIQWFVVARPARHQLKEMLR
jgi:hypothetical protein